MLSLLYVVGGAFVFYHIEEPNELAVRADSLRLIDQQKQRMIDHLWAVANNDSISERKFAALDVPYRALCCRRS